MTPIRVVTLLAPDRLSGARGHRERAVGGHRMQPVRERRQQPSIGLPE